MAGEVKVIGIDLASLSGTVSLTLTPTYGLPTTSQVVPVDQFSNTACFSVNGQLGISLKAHLLFFDPWSWTPDPITFHLGGCSVQTQDNPPPTAPPVDHHCRPGRRGPTPTASRPAADRFSRPSRTPAAPRCPGRPRTSASPRAPAPRSPARSSRSP